MKASMRTVPIASKKLFPGRDDASDVRVDPRVGLITQVVAPVLEPPPYISEDPAVPTLLAAVLFDAV